MRRTGSGAAREHLLDVAERLVAEHGLPALTVRELTRAAGVNLAQVNYVFGTKDSLLLGLQERLYRPMTADRLHRFAVLGARGGAGVRDAVLALLEPLDLLRREHEAAVVALFHHHVAHRDDAVRTASRALLEPVMGPFTDLVLRARPGLPPDLLRTRIALVCELAVPAVLRVLDAEQRAPGAPDLAAVVDFVTGALEAPPPDPPPR